jgi:hypothetical protein
MQYPYLDGRNLSRQERLAPLYQLAREVMKVMGDEYLGPRDPESFSFVVKKHDHFSSGRANRFQVHVSVGTDPVDARHVLIHEMCHAVEGDSYRDARGHPIRFFERVFSVTEAVGEPVEYALIRERNYKLRNATEAAINQGRTIPELRASASAISEKLVTQAQSMGLQAGRGWRPQVQLAARPAWTAPRLDREAQSEQFGSVQLGLGLDVDQRGLRRPTTWED